MKSSDEMDAMMEEHMKAMKKKMKQVAGMLEDTGEMMGMKDASQPAAQEQMRRKRRGSNSHPA